MDRPTSEAAEVTIVVNANHLPDQEVVDRLHPSLELQSGTAEMPSLPRPLIVVGSVPCVRFASTVAAEPDVAYVVVGGNPSGLREYEDRFDALLPLTAAPEDIRKAGLLALSRKRKQHRPRAIVGDESFGWRGQHAFLSSLEARIMRRLVAAQGAVVDKQALAYEIWGNYFCDPGRAVDTHIYRIRKRIAPIKGVELRTERQRGFRLILT